MSNFDQFAAKWLTNPPSKVADPLLAGDHPFQCVSFVKQGLSEIDGINLTNSWWGNAIDYWTKPNPAILAHRDHLETQDVQKGDVVILRTAGTASGDFSGYGHIGFATGNENSSQFELLEQNGQTGAGDGGPGDCIRTRWIAKSRIAGVLRTSSPPPPSAQRYTVTETYNPGKLIQLNKDTNLWGMNYDFATMVKQPVETGHKQGEVWTVTNKVHHEDNYDYYRRDGQVDGFNVLDCDDYTPPPPIPPAGPVAFPGNGTVYEVVVPLQGYQSATQAGNHSGTAQAVPEGEYFIFRYYSDARKDLINITKDKTKPGYWINSADNVIPPVPEPEPVPKIFIGPRESSTPEPEIAVVPETDQSWKASYTPLLTNRKPIAYVILQTTEIKDLASIGKTMGLKQYQEIHIYGTFEKDGITYGRPKLSNDSAFRYFYGIPLKLADGTDPGIAEPEQQLYNTDTTVAERKALGILTLHDRQIQLTATIEKYVEPAVKLIDGIIKRPKK